MPRAKGVKPKIGRPPTEISAAQWRTIEGMAQALCTHDEIADYLGVTKRTLYAPHIREKFERITKMKVASTKYRVRKRQMESALKGNPVASIWWGKQHLGQSDRSAITGADGGPLQFAGSAVDSLALVLDKLAKQRAEPT